jgi:hypothetical protein
MRPLRSLLAAAATGALAADCTASDRAVTAAKDAVCASLVQPGTGTPWCLYPSNVTAKEDWPSQSVYMQAVLGALVAAPLGCLDTPAAAAVRAWLEASQSSAAVSGSFANTWQVFQVQYYDMPRAAGERIEAPDTLGRKCWAFAYLQQIASPILTVLQSALASAGLPQLTAFVGNWSVSTGSTLALCDEVIANCFLNTTYQPSVHNGTCPGDVVLFGLGFQRENLLRGGIVAYPFWS